MLLVSGVVPLAASLSCREVRLLAAYRLQVPPAVVNCRVVVWWKPRASATTGQVVRSSL